jgi:hypothetical protein
MMKRLVTTAALVALLGAAGCTGADSGGTAVDETVIVTYDDMVAEWRAQQQTLELPPGAQWPDPPPEPEPEPDQEGVLRGWSYEAGVGKGIADQQWWCAWANEWLDQRGVDADRERAALETLRTLEDTYLYRESMDSHSQQSMDERITAAELGDPTMIATYVELNCDID